MARTRLNKSFQLRELYIYQVRHVRGPRHTESFLSTSPITPHRTSLSPTSNSFHTNLESCPGSHLKSCSSSQLSLNSAHLSHWTGSNRMLAERLTPLSTSTAARQRQVPWLTLSPRQQARQ